MGDTIPNTAFMSAPVKSFSVSKNVAIVKFRARSANVDHLSFKITMRIAHITHTIPNASAVSIITP